MAVSFKNLITRNYSGKVGDIVLRNYGWKSVMAKRPDCSKVVRSELQLANESRFAKAVKRSQKVLKDPERCEYYMKNKKKKHQDVYHASMSDCLTKPKVLNVDLFTYRGVQGNMIRISAWDKFRVETVSVKILNNKGQLIEGGTAVAMPFSGNREWDYTTTIDNVDYKSCRVLVRITDKPGNVVQEVITLDST